MNDRDDFDDTAQFLTSTLTTELPSDVEAGLRQHLKTLQARGEWTTGLAVASQGKRLRPSRLSILTVLCAVSLLLAVVLFPSGTSPALAQILDSITAKKWLHASGTGQDGQPAEIWYSPLYGVIAYRTGDSFFFVDQFQAKMDVFGKPFSTDSIQRTALDRAPTQGIRASQQSFLAMLTGDLPRAMKAGDAQILQHDEKSVVVDGQSRIEHRFVVGLKGEIPSQTENVLQTDPTTGLPITWQVKRGNQVLGDFSVSYPEKGPLSIVGLGAPADVPIVDHSPQGRFRDLLIANDSARRRFDSYHAVVIESDSSDRSQNGSYCRIWRKGNRWRIDRGHRIFHKDEQPPEGVDPETWWLQKARSIKSYPYEIWDGKRLWNFEARRPDPVRFDPDDPHALLIESLKVQSGVPIDSVNPQMHFGGSVKLPEQHAYESFARGAGWEGRAAVRSETRNNVLMTVVDITRPFDRHPNSVSPDRYWLDPEHGNMIVLKERFLVSNPDRPANAHEVVSMARTPQGLWYPTTVRDINVATSMETGEKIGWFHRYYLEFEVEMPDELFDGAAVDLKNFWTQFK